MKTICVSIPQLPVFLARFQKLNYWLIRFRKNTREQKQKTAVSPMHQSREIMAVSISRGIPRNALRMVSITGVIG